MTLCLTSNLNLEDSLAYGQAETNLTEVLESFERYSNELYERTFSHITFLILLHMRLLLLHRMLVHMLLHKILLLRMK